MPLTINPCIFVGLGTTGLRMLKELRGLFHEEFGTGGLPCFRYLVLETDKNAAAEDEFLGRTAKGFEKIDIKAITIRDISAIQKTSGMDSWLDNRLLDASNQRSYETGAGHRRQAGRLCLWENWPAVREMFTAAIEDVRKEANRTESEKVLRDYFKKKHPTESLPLNMVTNVPRAYIVGTLCGGTCSGTFLDIAYWFRKKLEVRNRSILKDTGNPEVIGIFTVPDTNSINDTKHSPHIASAWAALCELDYYSKDDSLYQVQLPGEASFQTKDEPFTTVYLESMINEGKTAFGRDDQKGFLQMCAMNLFTEIVSGMADVKSANRVNNPAAGTGFLRHNQKGHIQAFSSFGLSAVWYPRYRIAKAVNQRLGEEMADAWLGNEQVNKGNVETTAEKDWERAIDRALGSLLGSGAKVHCPNPPGNIPSQVSALLDERGGEFKRIGFDGLDEFFLKFPGGETTLSQKLSQNGEYYRAVAGIVPLVAGDLIADIEKSLVQYLKTHTLAESRKYSEHILSIAKSWEASLPGVLPGFSQKMDASFASLVFSDLASKLLFLRKEAESEYTEQLWNNFKGRMVKNVEKFGEFFLKQAIEQVLGDISRLDQNVITARNNLTTFKNTCEKERKEALKVPESSNIVIVSRNGVDSDISKDVDLRAAEILKREQAASLRERFIGSENPMTLLTGNVSNLLALSDERFDPLVQVEVNKFHIGLEALKEGLEGRIKSLVFSSGSYFEPTSFWQRMVTPQSPDFIFCRDSQARESLTEKANAYLTGAQYDGKESTLGHFVFFYQETPGLAISDLQIADFSAQKLEEEENKLESKEPTRYTHKLGRKMFDPAAILTISRQWAGEATLLAPEIFRKVGNDRFLPYDSAGRTKELYIDDEKELKRYLLENGLENYIHIFVTNLKPIGLQEMNTRMERRKESALTKTDRQNISNQHDEMRKAIFPSAY